MQSSQKRRAYFNGPVGRMPGGLAGVVLLAFSLTIVFSPTAVAADSIFSGFQEAREYRTAVGLLKQGDYSLARAQYQSFIDKYPDSSRLPRAYFGLAESYYLQEKYRQAARVYLKSLRTGQLDDQYQKEALKRGLDAVNRSRQYELGQHYLNQIDQSMEHVTDPIMRRVVQVLSRNNQPKLALKWAKRNFNQNPESKYWRYETALLHSDLEHYSRAETLLEPLLTGDSSYANDATYLMAEIHYEQKQYPQARQYYNELLGDSSYRDDARYGLAWIDIKKRNISAAKAKLKSLAESSESLRSRAARDLARIYRSEENDESTRVWYRRAIKWSQDPAASRLRIEFGDYFVNTDRLQKAVPYYEQARSLGLKGAKRLIRGYLVQNKYRRAARRIERYQSEGKLTEPVWDRRLALAYYHTGKYRNALDVLPDLSHASNREERHRILSLKGSLHYRLGQWKKSRSVYETMSREYSGVEPRYYLALIEEKLNDKHNAITRLESLRETAGDSVWSSRINYQLARLFYESGRHERYRAAIGSVNAGTLSRLLQNEIKLLKLAYGLKTNPGTSSMNDARVLRQKARKYGQLERWYGYLVQADPPETWWKQLLLPALFDNPSLQREWGARTIALLRRNNHLEQSFRVGKQLSDTSYSPPVNRTIRAELLTTLRLRKEYRLLGRYLPVESEWPNWTGSNLRSLGLALARYHRAMQQPRSAIQDLKKLKEYTRPNSTTETRLNELIAGFEIDLGRYQSARQRLREINGGDRSFSGDLNLAIASYQLGDTETSLRRIKRLHRQKKPAPLSLYDYGFRIMRDADKRNLLHRWSQELLTRPDRADTPVRKLLLDNIRYWVNNGHPSRGLEYIETIESAASTRSALVPLRYYRAMAYYNNDQLAKAETELESLQSDYNLSDRWLRRVLRSAMEISLRRDNWTGAYRHWKTLDARGLGGDAGGRLLTERGLRANPGAFGKLVSALETRYDSVLPDGEATFWRARLRERRNDAEGAVEFYRSYLNNNDSNHRQKATLRLARLYDKLGQHDQSRELYRSLLATTGDELYRLKAAVQLRKQGRLEESRTALKTVLDRSNSLDAIAWYQIGYTHLKSGSHASALESFRKSLRMVENSTNWSGDARRKTIELALKTGKLNLAQSLMETIDAGPRRVLYRAELNRQRNNLGKASSLIGSLSPDSFQTAELSDQYRAIAAAVHRENGDYGRLIELFDTVPETPRHRSWYVESFIETGQLDNARELLTQLSSSVRKDLTVKLADAYYRQSRWKSALELYRKNPGTTRTRFRIGNALRKLNRPGEAYETWKKTLGDTNKPNRKWTQSIFEGIRTLTPELKNWEESVRLLDRHWQRTTQDSSLALSGVKWALKTDDTTLARDFIERTGSLDSEAFETVARRLTAQDRWKLLHLWTGRYGESLGEGSRPLSLNYYRLLANLHHTGSTVDPHTINEHLNEALKKQSPYARKLQELLGDYHYRKANYQQAAIEYRKIDLLFETDAPDPRVKLNLARCYVEIGKPEKARPLFKSLNTESTPAAVRKEAKKWLQQHPGDS